MAKGSIYKPNLILGTSPVSGQQVQLSDESLNGPQTGNRVLRPLKVLIVDDNQDAADTLGLYINALGHAVCVVYTPTQALKNALQEKPDLCLLDIELPEMNGNVLALKLRAIPNTEKMVLAAVTGYAQEDDRTKALSSGFDHIFAKPVNTTRLWLLLDVLSAAKV